MSYPRLLSTIQPAATCLRHIIRKSSQVAETAKQVNLKTGSDIAKFTPGTRMHGFVVEEKKEIPEFKLIAVRLLHEKTKAQYLHLYRNDSNNVFSINFRTTPLNDTGLPHILEHLVLCGSKVYPVRDPFFKMLNRSLATFMNAMTGSDYTMYPFSTQNLMDYRNLQKIYLDAVFNPLLKELDFRQEGWRLENVDPKNIESPLIIKGVVYNEMKGVFSENDNILTHKVQNLILPEHTYGVISGGDPLKIPNLTWEDLKEFHKKHYHPSNCRFFSYGKFTLEPNLLFINDKYLSNFKYENPSHTAVPMQTRWTEPRQAEITGRYLKLREPIAKQNTLSISYVMTDLTEIYDTFVLQFITELMIRGPNTPFYKSLIEPNFSSGFTPSTGYDTEPRDTVFTLGLQGLNKMQFPKVIKIFDDTITAVIKDGFDQKHIDSVLHRYELQIKHESSNFGLNLLFGITAIWNHHDNIVEALSVNKLLKRLKDDLRNDDKFLQKYVDKYFKKNKHKLILTMIPDKEYEQKQDAAEKEVISAKTKDLTKEDKQKIYDLNLQLLQQQEMQQDLKILPTLVMDDINDAVERTPKENVKIEKVNTQINKVNPNGIVYFRGILSTSDLSPEQQMLLPLFCNVITRMGTKEVNYKDFDNLVNTKTGGLNVGVHIAESLYNLHNYEPSLQLSSYCLEKNVDSMWDLWSKVFNIKELYDVGRFETLVKLYMSDLTQGLADAGHLYAMQAAAGLVSGTAYQRDLLSGLQHIAYMKRLVHISNYKAMLDEILNIAQIVFDKHRLRCCLNISNDVKPDVVKHMKGFVRNIPGSKVTIPMESAYITGKILTPKDAVNCQHHVLNVGVHYCSKAVLTVPYTKPDFARLRVLARLLSAKYLHPELREKQGAYGGGARLTFDGVFTFYSYRDPRHLKTLDIFDGSYDWLKANLTKLTKQDLVEAKLGVFQSIDSPHPPSSKGTEEFLRMLTPDIVERHRAEVMAVSMEGLQAVSEKYLRNLTSPLSSKVIVGPKSADFKTTGRLDELWTIIDNE